MDAAHKPEQVANFFTSWGGASQRRPVSLWRCHFCHAHPYQVRDHHGQIIRFYGAVAGEQIAILAREVLDSYVRLPKVA